MDITIKNLSKSFDNHRVFDNLNLSLTGGAVNCILGVSGSGKTTLMNVLAGLCDYDGEITGLPDRVSYIFQTDRLLDGLTVKQNIDFVIKSCLDKSERKERIDKLIKLVELEKWGDKRCGELSGGMRRRVSIAQAFAYPSGLVLMDEPFSALDIGLKLRQIKVFDALLKERERTVLFVTHDIDEALLFADKITLLSSQAGIIKELTDCGRENRSIVSDSSVAIKKEILSVLTHEIDMKN